MQEKIKGTFDGSEKNTARKALLSDDNDYDLTACGMVLAGEPDIAAAKKTSNYDPVKAALRMNFFVIITKGKYSLKEALQ